MDYDYNQYVWHAIQRTKQHDPEYFRKCIEQLSHFLQRQLSINLHPGEM